MKKRGDSKETELRPEYDLAELLKGGERGRYVRQYEAGTNLVLIEPEIHSVFRTGEEVNEALRLVIELRQIGKPGKASGRPRS